MTSDGLTDALELLRDLEARGATFYLDHEGLHCVTSVEDRLDEETYERLFRHRTALIAVLQAEAAARGDEL